jgi:hypothetical protein
MLDVTLSLCTRRGDTWPKKRCSLFLFKKKVKIWRNLYKPLSLLSVCELSWCSISGVLSWPIICSKQRNMSYKLQILVKRSKIQSKQ